METKIQIEKLSNINYFTWKLKMEFLLIKEDLWSVISNEPDTALTRREQAQRELKDNKARALIGLSIENNQLVHIRGKNTALEVWNSLKEAHLKDTLTNRISLYKQIALLKFKQGDKMEQHVDLLTELFQRLSDLGEESSDSWKIGMLFASLPKDYSTLVTALEARNESDLTWSLVLTKLFDEYQRQLEDFDSYNERILSLNNNLFCRYCKRNSHDIKNCRYLKAKRQRDANNRSLPRSQSTQSLISSRTHNVESSPSNNQTNQQHEANLLFSFKHKSPKNSHIFEEKEDIWEQALE